MRWTGKENEKEKEGVSDGDMKVERSRTMISTNVTDATNLAIFARDLMCPARDKTCKQCGRRGHYAVCCKTKGADNSKPKRTTKDTAYNLRGSKEEYYAFTIETDRNQSGLVNLKVGGVTMTSVVIDSGATCNVMDKATWETLKQSRVKCTSQTTGSKLFLY